MKHYKNQLLILLMAGLLLCGCSETKKLKEPSELGSTEWSIQDGGLTVKAIILHEFYLSIQADISGKRMWEDISAADEPCISLYGYLKLGDLEQVPFEALNCNYEKKGSDSCAAVVELELDACYRESPDEVNEEYEEEFDKMVHTGTVDLKLWIQYAELSWGQNETKRGIVTINWEQDYPELQVETSYQR